MEDTLKLILSELKELKEGQKKLEGKIDHLTKKEEEHFDLLLSEQHEIYNSLDKRIATLETRV